MCLTERIAAITPLRVKFQSEDGQEQITVIQRNASEIKQSLLQVSRPLPCLTPRPSGCSIVLTAIGSQRLTLRLYLQITDLSQLGDLSEVALLLLPREVTVEAQGSAVLERPVIFAASASPEGPSVCSRAN